MIVITIIITISVIIISSSISSSSSSSSSSSTMFIIIITIIIRLLYDIAYNMQYLSAGAPERRARPRRPMICYIISRARPYLYNRPIMCYMTLLIICYIIGRARPRRPRQGCPATWKHGWSRHGSSIIPWNHSIPQDLYSPCLSLTNSARTMFTPTMFSRRRDVCVALLIMLSNNNNDIRWTSYKTSRHLSIIIMLWIICML